MGNRRSPVNREAPDDEVTEPGVLTGGGTQMQALLFAVCDAVFPFVTTTVVRKSQTQRKTT